MDYLDSFCSQVKVISTILLLEDRFDSIMNNPEGANNIDFRPVRFNSGNELSQLTNIFHQLPKQFRIHFAARLPYS